MQPASTIFLYLYGTPSLYHAVNMFDRSIDIILMTFEMSCMHSLKMCRSKSVSVIKSENKSFFLLFFATWLFYVFESIVYLKHQNPKQKTKSKCNVIVCGKTHVKYPKQIRISPHTVKSPFRYWDLFLLLLTFTMLQISAGCSVRFILHIFPNAH